MRKLAIPATHADRLLPDLLREQAHIRPEAPHAIFPDRIMTFGELDRLARAWAASYRALGVQPGDHIATLMPNCPAWLPAYYGALYAGAVTVALNARYKRHELAFTLRHSEAKVLVTTDAFAEFVDYAALLGDVLSDAGGQDATSLSLAAAPHLKAVVLTGGQRESWMLTEEAFLAAGTECSDGPPPAGSPDDTAVILYTSGTTANPKGCELTHASIQNSWSTFAHVVGLAAGETVWIPMPFFHTGGVGPMTTILARGAAFVSQAHYEPDVMVDLIERHRVDHLYPGFPQLTFGIIEHQRFDRRRFDHVRSLLNVGPPAMQRRIQDLLPDGAVLVNLFGMTEGSGIVTFTAADAPFAVRAETSGLPPPHTDVRIVDPGSGMACEPGQPGEIQFTGGGAFKAYYNDPAATAATILPGGWVRTGDRGVIDADGYLVYLGRLKDMLKVGGENVAASEIEAFVQGLGGVHMVQVIGVPDDRLGEVPVAFVELSAGASLDEEGIIAACDGQLARWKVPRRVVFVRAWPMSSTKVQKFRLVELLEGASA
ncbi:class I adenylate-forming enzyme family protein [Parablastomonas sp. CN1-191]|uniref:class I adenylate-forming enzyme family protein n=1 Tax=Parablastomonas sp. CN1-191 TaxID=3400908 RepID=UPI003BF81B7B